MTELSQVGATGTEVGANGSEVGRKRGGRSAQKALVIRLSTCFSTAWVRGLEFFGKFGKYKSKPSLTRAV